MYYIAVRFESIKKAIDADYVTMRGLHGVLFNVLEQCNPAEAEWLHQHPTPKPFSMAPYYREEDGKGILVGVRYAAITDRAATLIYEAWQRVYHTREMLRLGKYQTFRVEHVEVIHKWNFAEIAQMARQVPQKKMVLEFLSPTSFKQGPGHLPLPLPRNVFQRPLRVWQCYAPMVLSIPADWLDWCEQDVFVEEHQIQTGIAAITHKQRFIGFTGQVSFCAYKGEEQYLRVWQALGSFAAFCGVGHTTTMGMGAVERL